MVSEFSYCELCWLQPLCSVEGTSFLRENQRQIIPDKASQAHVEGLMEMPEYTVFITIFTLLASEWPYPLNRLYTCHGWHVTETVIYCNIKKPFVVCTCLGFQTLQPFCGSLPCFFGRILLTRNQSLENFWFFFLFSHGSPWLFLLCDGNRGVSSFPAV